MPTSSELIAQALDQQRTRYQQESPFYQAGRAVIASRPTYNTGNAWTDALLTGAQGAVGGLMAGYGQGGIDQSMQGYSQGLDTSLRSGNPTESLLSNPDYAPLGAALEGVQYQNSNLLQDAIKKSAAEAVLQNQMTSGNAPGFSITADENGNLKFVPIAQALSKPVESQIGTIASPAEITGYPELATAYQQKVQEGWGSAPAGMSRVQRSDYAKQYADNWMTGAKAMLEGKTKSAISTYGAADKLRADADKLNALASQVNAAIESGAYTGPGGNVAYRWNQLQGALGDQASKDAAAAQSTFANILPDVIAGKRPPGAFTEKEWDIMRQSFPSLTKTDAENKYGAEIVQRTADLASAHADLLETARDAGLTKSEADRIWNAYKQQNPIAVSVGGKVQINPNPGHWSDIWNVGKPVPKVSTRLGGDRTQNVIMPRGAGGGITTIDPQAGGGQGSAIQGVNPPPGFQATGRTYNGKPVYSNGKQGWVPD